MKITTFIATLILVLVGVLSLTWVFQGNDFFLYRYFAPKQEAVRRNVFETSRAFNQGMIQELENMQFEYVHTKGAEEKAALASIILHRASGYNLNDPSVPVELRTFIQNLKQQNNVRY